MSKDNLPKLKFMKPYLQQLDNELIWIFPLANQMGKGHYSKQ